MMRKRADISYNLKNTENYRLTTKSKKTANLYFYRLKHISNDESDGTEQLVCIIEHEDGVLTRLNTVDFSDLKKIKNIVEKVNVYPQDIALLIGWIQDERDNIPLLYKYSGKWGWDSLFTRSSGMQKYFCGSRLGGFYEGCILEESDKHLKWNGNNDYIVELCNEVMTDKPLVQFLIAASLAAPIIGLLSMDSVIINIAGKTSQGKTIISKLCTAIWSRPDDKNIVTSWFDTDFKLVDRLNNNEGILFVIDDTSKGIKRKDYATVLYHLEQANERGRVGKHYEKGTEAEWHTVILSSSEHSLYEHCDKTKKGILRRLIEIPSEHGDLTSCANEAVKIKEITTYNYGTLGMELIDWYCKQKEDFGDDFLRYKKDELGDDYYRQADYTVDGGDSLKQTIYASP